MPNFTKFTFTWDADLRRKLKAAVEDMARRAVGDFMSEQHEEMRRALTGRPDPAPAPWNNSILNSRRPGAFQDDSLDTPVPIDEPLLPVQTGRLRRSFTPAPEPPISLTSAPEPPASLRGARDELRRLNRENERLRQQLMHAALAAPAPVYLLPMRAGEPYVGDIEDAIRARAREALRESGRLASSDDVAAEDAKPLPSRKIVTD